MELHFLKTVTFSGVLLRTSGSREAFVASIENIV